MINSKQKMIISTGEVSVRSVENTQFILLYNILEPKNVLLGRTELTKQLKKSCESTKPAMMATLSDAWSMTDHWNGYLD